MPIYEYEATSEEPCDHCRQRFEVYQGFSDKPLKKCPQCGGKVERVFSTPSIHGAGRSAEVLSNKNLAEKGFTRYQKAGDGVYEKTAGKGPKVIKR